jgi:hypothetical protein
MEEEGSIYEGKRKQWRQENMSKVIRAEKD